jgi:molecular chaperone GrpE
MAKKSASPAKKTKSTKATKNSPEALKDKLKMKDADIKLLKKENQRLNESYLRKMADMENLKKRLEREKTEFYQYALSEFLKELFVVLDNFERALESQDEGNGRSFREGVEMIYKQYQDMLVKFGARPIEIKGKKFDPHLHQAFITEESEDVQEPEIIEELQKGYTLHNRLLRPSLVKVAVPKKSE